MTALRLNLCFAAVTALSWLIPSNSWPGGHGPDLVLALTVMVAAVAPLDRAAVAILVSGLIDDCLSGAVFGARGLSLLVVAVAVGALVRHMHSGTLWVRLALLFAASLATPVLVGALGYDSWRLHLSFSNALATSFAGLLAWGVVVSTPSRRAAW